MAKQMEFEEYAELIERLIDQSAAVKLRHVLNELHAVDVAEILDELDPLQRQQFYRLTEHERSGETASYLPSEMVAEDLGALDPKFRARVLNEMSDDDLVDVVQEYEKDEQEQLLPLLSENRRAQVRRLLGYGEETAGGRMTTIFAAVRDNMTVGQAKARLEAEKERLESFARIFVTDSSGHLLGRVRLRDLTFAENSTPISDIMSDDTTSAHVDDDQEDAARKLMRYDLVALPVVNHQGVLVGMITHDDAIDIIEEESTEDIELMNAMASSQQGDPGYLDTSVWRHFKRRIGWVIGLAALGLISGYIIYGFEDVLNAYFILAIYMPVLVAAGGNTGGQAATLVIRAMSLGEFEPKALAVVLWKEARIGIMLGLVLAVLFAIKIVYFSTPAEREGVPDLWPIAITVSGSFVAQVVFSTTIGAFLPICARAAKLDPAVVASPAITTFVDVSGLLIYFLLAKAILGL